MRVFNRTILLLIVCFMLASCLPGKKQEEAVIQKATDATISLRLEKVAADMGNAALTLMASNIPATNSDNLQTFRCGDNKHVVAYVPKTSKLTRDGTMPADMANRMRSRLQLDFTPDAVKKASAGDLSSCPGISVENIALNSPVLVLQSFANENVAVVDPEVVQIKIENCKDANGQSLPGIIVKKIAKDGNVETVSHCGQRISGTVDLGLGETQMPNWKKRLAGDTTAYVPFRCVVRDKDKSQCVAIENIDPGLVLKCDTAGDVRDEYVANPDFDSTTGKFITGADRSCGRGWTGQLIARVKSKSCQLVRGKQNEGEIVSVKEVAYVSAQCHRDNLVNLETACPANSDNPFGTFFVKRDNAQMKMPMALQPQVQTEGNKIVSPIALSTYQPSAEDRAGIAKASRTQSLFIPTNDNLRSITDPTNFMNALIKDMGDNIELSAISGCSLLGNTCIMGAAPDHVVVIVDRSASMGSALEEDKLLVHQDMAANYQCKAGLKNLFTAEKAQEACTLVKNYVQTQQVSNAVNLKLVDFIKSPWAKDVSSSYGPKGDKQTLYTAIEEMLSDRTKYAPHLQFALTTGWDCAGRTVAGTQGKEPFPMNMFGSCSGPECGSTCPGECIQNDLVTIPSPPKLNRIETANLILQRIAHMKLKAGTKVTVGTFVNDQPSVVTTTYCASDRRSSAGTCDENLELKNLLSVLVRGDNTKAYVKPIEQEVIIPTEKIGTTTPVTVPSTPFKVFIVPDSRQETGWMNEANTTWQAPANTVITGRHQKYPQIKYEYATLKAVDEKGKVVAGKITVEDAKWYGNSRSPGGDYFAEDCGLCPPFEYNRPMVGRQRTGNNTRHLLALVKFDGKEARVPSSGGTVVSTPVNMNTSNFYKTPTDMVMMRRQNGTLTNGQKNMTHYVAGKMELMVTPPPVTEQPSSCSANGTGSGTATDGWENLAQARANNPVEGWDPKSVFYNLSDPNNPHEYRNCTEEPICTQSYNIWTQPPGYALCIWGPTWDKFAIDNATTGCGTVGAILRNSDGTACGICSAPNSTAYNQCQARLASTYANHFGLAAIFGNGGKINFCTERRLKGGSNTTEPEQCEDQCDVSMCATLVGAKDAVCVPGAYETVAQAKASGSIPNANATEYKAAAGSEYRDTFEVDCYTPRAQCDYFEGLQNPHQADIDYWCGEANRCEADFDQAVKTNWLVEGCATCYGGTSGGQTSGSVFAKERRVPCDTNASGNAATQTEWKTATQAKADGTFNDSNNKLEDYEFRSCQSVTNCDAEQASCDYSATPEECGPGSRLAQCLQSYNAALSAMSVNRWDTTDRSTYNCNHFASCNSIQETFCTERRQKASAAAEATNSALASCLDRCAPKKRTGSLSVQSCMTVTNLFSGVTADQCKTNTVSTTLDYRPEGYKGKYVTAKLRSNILAKRGDAGAVEAPVGSMIYGADYGGFTPLLETVDTVLSAADVVADMNAKKRIRFVVLTDGMSTDSKATTVKDLCNSQLGETLVSKVGKNESASTLIIGMSDTSLQLQTCRDKLKDNYISTNVLREVVMPKLNSFLAAAAAATENESLAAAKDFCLSYYPNVGERGLYTEPKPPSAVGTGTGGVNICRPYEIQK